MLKKFLFIIMLAIILLPASYAASGSIKLLAARETPGTGGSVADLTLEIQSGKGRVFIQTLPLTKLDTQISTRFAKEISCKLVGQDCSDYDFIYTIKSDSSIVGGPSAGGAIAVLTVAVLQGIRVNENIAMTGTINSGNLIGTVGAVRDKIEAAFNAGLRKVLIPKGDRFDDENKTIDLVEYGKELGIEVIEVSDLRDAIFEFTGKNFSVQLSDIGINDDYKKIMSMLSELLCNRTQYLQEKFLESSGEISKEILGIELDAVNLTGRSVEARKNESYYSAASYCFGANVKYRNLLLLMRNMTKTELNAEILRISNLTSEFESLIEKKEIKTLSDLQAFMIVSERILNTHENLATAALNSSDKEGYLALGTERLFSAASWSFFFNMPGREFNINKEVLRDSCITKISEAQERVHYVNLFIPLALEGTKESISQARGYLENQRYELCLFKASKAKAEADSVLSVFGADEDQLDNILNDKLNAAQRNIIEQSSEGVFPIVGYSYYEYANSLKEYDKFSSLLYVEYALELSNIDVYFKQKEKKFRLPFNREKFSYFIVGTAFGIIAALALFPKPEAKKRKQKRRNSR